MPLVSYPSTLSNPRALLVPRFDTDVVGLLVPRLVTVVVLVVPIHLDAIFSSSYCGAASSLHGEDDDGGSIYDF
jgi:hypothetical protein